METPFRFVIIGSGNICRTYFQAIQHVKQATITGLVSRSLHRPDFVEQDIEIAAALDQIQIPFDGVIVATPNGLHHEGAQKAAQLGKHVLTEKPLDISIANMDRMISACHEAGVKLATCFQHRMSPDNRKIKEMLAAGLFGKIYAADYMIRCWRDQKYYDSAAWRGGWDIDGGGPFIQQACHEIDLYTWFFGQPEKVYSLIDTFAHDIEVEDHGAALFHHADGMIGTFIASTVAYPGFDPVLTIYTQKGTLVLTNGRITGWHIAGIENPSQEPDKPLHSGAASAAVTDTSGHEAIIKDFINSIQEGREPAISGKSARASTELILRIYGKLDNSEKHLM